MIKKQITLLSFNTQRGSHIPDDIAYINKLIDQDYDYYQFQRFPLKWLIDLKTKHHVYSTPSYPGADNGQVTITKEKPLSSLAFYSSEKKFKDTNQSSGSILLRFSHFSLLNTLPPYRSKDDNLSLLDTLNHIKYVFGGLNGPSIVSGDFHERDHDINDSFPKNFRIINTKNNFTDANKKMMKLSKLLVNFEVKLQKEDVIKLDVSQVTHYPIIFNLIF